MHDGEIGLPARSQPTRLNRVHSEGLAGSRDDIEGLGGDGLLVGDRPGILHRHEGDEHSADRVGVLVELDADGVGRIGRDRAETDE